MRRILVVAVVAFGLACGSDDSTVFKDGGGDATTSDGAVAYANVVVEPPDTTLTVPISGSAPQDYKAYADFNGQTHVDVTSQCTFAVADGSLGTFSAAHFASTARGGDTTVTAKCNGSQGTANLHLILKGWILATGAPQNAPTTFSTATLGTDPSHTPTLEYPVDKAVAPLNIPSVDFQ